jgi:hypothetical protein
MAAAADNTEHTEHIDKKSKHGSELTSFTYGFSTEVNPITIRIPAQMIRDFPVLQRCEEDINDNSGHLLGHCSDADGTKIILTEKQLIEFFHLWELITLFIDEYEIHVGKFHCKHIANNIFPHETPYQNTIYTVLDIIDQNIDFYTPEIITIYIILANTLANETFVNILACYISKNFDKFR